MSSGEWNAVEMAEVGRPSAKKERKSYSVQFKLQVLSPLEEPGMSLRKLSRETGLDCNHLRYWKRNKAKWEPLKKKRTSRYVGSGRKAQYPEIDRLLFVYFKSEREKRHSVTYKNLREFLHR